MNLLEQCSLEVILGIADEKNHLKNPRMTNKILQRVPPVATLNFQC
jgi:hypothetical protein